MFNIHRLSSSKSVFSLIEVGVCLEQVTGRTIAKKPVRL